MLAAAVLTRATGFCNLLVAAWFQARLPAGTVQHAVRRPSYVYFMPEKGAQG